MKVFHPDETFDGQLLRLLTYTYERGTDYGECISTATRIKAHDIESWYAEWHALAERIETVAKVALAKDHKATAHEAYLRASMYHRASGQFLIGSPDDERLLTAFSKSAICFQESMKLSTTVKCEIVKIPYKDGKYFPGYFLTPIGGHNKSGQTVIINGGYDSNKEECYLFSGAAALRRGYSTFLFDGPGQGLTFVEQGVTTIPEWENVITPVVDYLHTRTDVDKTKIAAMGISFGGYQVPRAVTKEKRISAIICDPAQIDIGKKTRARLPLPLSWKASYPKDTPWWAVSIISRFLARRMADPSGGWTIRRILHVHGLKDVNDMFTELDKFHLDPQEVTCPAFIAFAEKDLIAQECAEFEKRIGSKEKKLVRYTEHEGAEEHCEAGCRALFNENAFDWLEEIFT